MLYVPSPFILAKGPLSYTYNGDRNITSAASVSITNYPLGTPAGKRLVVISAAVAGSGNNRTILSTSSIAGVPILGSTNSPGNNTTIHLMWAVVPTGTTGTVSINFSGSGFARQLRTTGYSIYNAESTPHAIGSINGGGKSTRTSSATTSKPSVIIAAVVSDQDIPTNGWSGTAGVTQDFRYRDGNDGFASASNLKQTTGNYNATCSNVRAITSVAFAQ